MDSIHYPEPAHIWPIGSYLDCLGHRLESLRKAIAVLNALCHAADGDELADQVRWVNNGAWNEIEEGERLLEGLRLAVRQANADVEDANRGEPQPEPRRPA